MENTTYTRAMTTNSIIIEQATFERGLAQFRQVMTCFVSTRQATRKTTTIVSLTYEEVHDDVERVIASVAQKYTDQSCSSLHFDELVAECRAKTAKLVSDGHLTRVRSRVEFFKIFTTAIKNHVRSLVLKFRYTEKRTGIKPPPRRKREDVLKGTADQHEHRKNVEVSLDDPNYGLQVQDEQQQQHDEKDAFDMMEDYLRLLTPVEQLVLRQLTEPNLLALLHAHVDAHSRKGKICVKVKPCHLAEGIGMAENQFEHHVLTIREKIKTHRAMSNEQQEIEARFNAAVSTLSTVFNVQVPISQYVNQTLIRRLFSIAARVEYQKVNAEVAALLVEIGALVPKFVGSTKECFGWTDMAEPACNECGINVACLTKAISVGLDKHKPSPKLGGIIIRIPVVIPRITETNARSTLKARIALSTLTSSPAPAPAIAPVPVIKTAPPTTSAVLDYLRETYEEHTETKNGVTSVYAGIKHEKNNNLRRLFCIASADPLLLRFCGPKLALCLRLNKQGKNHYLPLNLTTDEAIALIDEHTNDVLKRYGKGTAVST